MSELGSEHRGQFLEKLRKRVSVAFSVSNLNAEHQGVVLHYVGFSKPKFWTVLRVKTDVQEL